MKKFNFYHAGLIIMSILLILSASCNERQHAPSIQGKEITLRLEPGPGNPRNSEGDFIQLKDGRILFVYTHFTGGHGDHANAYLAGRFSDDGGKTWTTEDVLIVPNEGGMNVMSVSLLRLANGKIALFYLRKNSQSDCIPYMRISSDEGKSWSEPERCIDAVGYYVLNNDRVVQLSNGRLVLPVSLHKTPDSDWSNRGRIMCYYSDNNGESWQQSSQVPNPERIVLQEPGIVELKNGSLMMFCRTNAGVQYLSFSQDRGEHWSPTEPSEIKSPMSPASIERIPASGDLLLVWNNNDKSNERDAGKRTPFNLAISRDEGKTWEKVKTIESDPFGWYCYTAIEFVNDHVLLAHCAGDRKKNIGLETTQITRLSMDWVYSEQTPDPCVSADSNGVVELSCPKNDAEIRYTRDGSMPTANSPRYKGPIQLKGVTLLRMQAWHRDMTPSRIVSVKVGPYVYQDAQPVGERLSKGLTYQYYEGSCRRVADIDKLPLLESGVVSQFSLAKRKRDENFAFHFTGYIQIPGDGIYTFYLISNDGSKLYLNDAEFIDNDGPHGAQEVSDKAALRAGNHKIDLTYFQMGGNKLLKVLWQGPGFDKTEIPASVLFHVKN